LARASVRTGGTVVVIGFRSHSKEYEANLLRLPRQLRILRISLLNASFNFHLRSLKKEKKLDKTMNK